MGCTEASLPCAVFFGDRGGGLETGGGGGKKIREFFCGTPPPPHPSSGGEKKLAPPLGIFFKEDLHVTFILLRCVP